MRYPRNAHQCQCQQHAPGMGNVGLELPDLSTLVPDFDQTTLLYIGGGLLAVFIGYQLLSGGSKATRSKTATAKARYISEFAAQTGRLPKV